MNVSDTCCQHGYTKISNFLALFWICTLAHTYNAIFLAADRTNFCLKRHSHALAYSNKFLGLLDILFDRQMRTIKHDGGETSLDALIASFIGSMIQMQSNRNSDVHFLNHRLYHSCYCTETGHILTSTLGNTKDNRALQFLCGCKDCLGPLQVIDIELAYCILAGLCFLKHLFSCY